MATESTAIVNLLDLVKKKPMERAADDDLLFGGQVRFDPMAMPAPAQPIMLPQLPQPYNQRPVLDEGKTHRVMRAPAGISPKKLAVPAGVFVLAMVVLSIYLAKSGGKHVAAKTTVVHAPQPTVETLMPEVPPPAPPPPVVAAAVAPAAAPAQQPTVTEIPTEAPPAVAAAQPTVPDVQPTVPTVPTVADAPAADETPVAKPASKHHHHAAAAKRAKPAKHVAAADDDDKIASLARAAKAKSEKPETEKTESLGGKGALQISSSPARVLWVDGHDTKSMTPQKVTLAPGTHNITLFDKTSHSAKTFQVEIKPNQTTRISKSY